MQRVEYFLKRVTRRALVCLPALLFVTVLAQAAQAQFDQYGRWENGITEPWFVSDFTKEEINAVQTLWQAIEAENRKQSTHEWAGDYFVGSEVHGTYLRWSPQSGFIIANVDKCQARLMGLTYGKVMASPTLIRFLPEFSKTASMSHGHSQSHAKTPAELRFLPVKGRGDHFLVADDQIREFGNYVAGLGNYNDPNRFLLDAIEFFTKSRKVVLSEPVTSETNEAARVDESPFVLPPGYERYLKKPIDAQITEIGPGYRKRTENQWWDDSIIRVKINAGSAHGVQRRMSFKVIDSKGFGGSDEAVEVTHVGLRSSQGRIVRTIRKRPCVKIDATDDCKEIEYQTLKVGQRITTNPFN